jgi:alanyl-tRNA synthetase
VTVRDTFLKFFEERGHTFGECGPNAAAECLQNTC